MAIKRKRSYAKKSVYGRRKGGVAKRRRFTIKSRRTRPRVGNKTVKRTYLPLTQICSFKRTEEMTVTVTENGLVVKATRVMKPMQVNDPFDHNDNLHQCSQWDLAMANYGKATVLSSTCSIRKVEDTKAPAMPIYWGAYTDNCEDPKFHMLGKSMAQVMSITGIAKPALSGTGSVKAGQGYNKGNFKKISFIPSKYYRIASTDLLKTNTTSNIGTAVTTNQYTCGADYTHIGASISSPSIYLYACAPTTCAESSSATFLVTMEYKVLLNDRIEAADLLDPTS